MLRPWYWFRLSTAFNAIVARLFFCNIDKHYDNYDNYDNFKKDLILARRIVTQELVNIAADELASNNLKPSIISVQKYVGGGSYSTVKRCLDVWQKVRNPTNQSVSDSADSQQIKSVEPAENVWIMATIQNTAEIQKLKAIISAQEAAIHELRILLQMHVASASKCSTGVTL